MRRLRQLPPRRQWWVAPAAFVATLLTLPVNAGIVIPDDPLTTAARVAPNVLFILDDSGSMADDNMPNQRIGTICTRNANNNCVSGSNITQDTYVGNTLYYDPAVTYEPWTKADGTRMTGGTSYGAAYGSFNLVGGTTINLADAEDCHTFNNNNGANGVPYADEISGGTEVCGGVKVFYVPKDASITDASYLRNAANYYRYQIALGGADILRGEYGAAVITNNAPPDENASGYPQIVPRTTTNASPANRMEHVYTVTLPPGEWDSMRVTLSGGTHGTNNPHNNNGGNGADLYVNDDSDIRTNSYTCRSTGGSNDESCEIDNPVAGTTWYIGVNRDSSFGGVSLNVVLRHIPQYQSNRCDGSNTPGNTWINCASALPNTKRDLAEELSNYATWFSYHRTRMKAAKAGAGDAFKPMGNNVRVGFRTIWERGAEHDNPIPVNDGNDGRFVDNPDDPGTAVNEATNTRSTWYSRMYGAIGYNGTPLHGALDGAGQYFSDTSATGPYGPQATASQYTCRQNFAILTTDGYWNNDSNYSGTYSITNGSWSGGVEEQDNAAGTEITGPNEHGPNARRYTYSPVSPYASSYAGTLADVAMKYWKTDLRPQANMTNNVPTSDADPAFWQHMVTFGISIGLSGASGWNSVGQVLELANVVWGNPNDMEDADRIDDLLHAAVNGHGAFVSASKPSEFAAGLSAALAAIDKRTSSYSNVATNSASLRTGAMVFNASYVAGTWTGDVKGYAVSKAGGVSATPEWSATIPLWSSRNVYTAGGTFPTEAQRASLERTGGPVNYPVSGTENANYLKGDQSKEGASVGALRRRTSLLGDIVGSSPEYVEDTDTLYVGANDGMLHAFDASNGRELFAYVPGIIDMSRLRDLSRGDYTHKFFVDGPVVASSRTLTPDKNILIGTLGRGGRGLYALDVTNARSMSTTSPFLWEKTSASSDYANLGQVLGKPILARVSTGRPAVVLGNGVNSANDRAVLIVADLETGGVIAEIDTGEGDADAPNGLSTPTGILGPDGKTLAYVYAGDMLGNVWKFDLTDSSSANWTKTKLFSAKSNGGAGAAQPITAAVAVATDPRTFKRWLFFGTGRFLTTADAEDKSANAQGMYGLIDEDIEIAYSALEQRGLTGTGTTRAFDTKATLPAGKKGWYVNLPGDGERIVQDVQIESNVLVTASMIPTGDGCEAGGSGYINAVDAFTGTSTGKSYFHIDVNGDGVVDANDTVNGNSVGSVNYGVGMPTLPILFPGRIVVGGTGGDGGGGGGAAGGGRKFANTWSRVTWREIRQD